MPRWLDTLERNGWGLFGFGFGLMFTSWVYYLLPVEKPLKVGDVVFHLVVFGTIAAMTEWRSKQQRTKQFTWSVFLASVLFTAIHFGAVTRWGLEAAAVGRLLAVAGAVIALGFPLVIAPIVVVVIWLSEW